MSDDDNSSSVIHHRCPRCDESIFFDEENQICDKCEWGLDEGREEETTTCVVCGKDLTDPKNAGDPDENGDWVCTQNHCRAVHDVPMTVKRTVIRTQDTGADHDAE